MADGGRRIAGVEQEKAPASVCWRWEAPSSPAVPWRVSPEGSTLSSLRSRARRIVSRRGSQFTSNPSPGPSTASNTMVCQLIENHFIKVS